MAKLSKREQAAKKAGVQVNYNLPASKQVSHPKMTALKSSLTKKSPSSSPKTQKSSVSDPYSSKEYKSLQNSLTGSLSPTAEETAAQTALGNIETEQANLDLGTKMGVAGIEKQAIPLNLVTGQSAELQKQAGLASEAISQKALPLKTQLANLQAKRQAAQDVAKMKLDEFKSKLDYKTQQQKAAEEKAISQRDFAEKQREFNLERERLKASSGGRSLKQNELLATAQAFQKTGGDWEKTAKLLANQGYDVSEGSSIDNELRRRAGLSPVYKPSKQQDTLAADYWVNQIGQGNAQISNVPADMRNEVVKRLGGSQNNQSNSNLVTAPDGQQYEIVD